LVEGQVFCAAEAARRLGVSLKALRIYEQRGLLRPKRTKAGWRIYGAKEFARIKEVLALKGLGLSLAQIADLLGKQRVGNDVRTSLDVQRAALLEQRDKIDRALALVDVARRRVAAGEVLDPEALAGSLQDQPVPARPWTAWMQRFYDEHLESGDWVALLAASESPWLILVKELKELAAQGTAPGSAKAQSFMKRWIKESERASGGDPALSARMAKAWEAAMLSPNASATLPIRPEEFAYLKEVAVAYAEAHEV
jgi:DNA-binding transcriptional MerR regulator